MPKSISRGYSCRLPNNTCSFFFHPKFKHITHTLIPKTDHMILLFYIKLFSLLRFVFYISFGVCFCYSYTMVLMQLIVNKAIMAITLFWTELIFFYIYGYFKNKKMYVCTNFCILFCQRNKRKRFHIYRMNKCHICENMSQFKNICTRKPMRLRCWRWRVDQQWRAYQLSGYHFLFYFSICLYS